MESTDAAAVEGAPAAAPSGAPEGVPPLADHLCVVIEGLGEGPGWGDATEAALGVPGVKRVFVSHPMETMYLSYDPEVTTAVAVREALVAAGLRVKPERRRA